jgi:hypothetical protein
MPAMAAELMEHVRSLQEGLLLRGPPWPQLQGFSGVSGDQERATRVAGRPINRRREQAEGLKTRFEG